MARTASFDEIRAAYRNLARRYHPDADGSDGSAMAAVNAAWEVLSDPTRRARYDQALTPPPRYTGGQVPDDDLDAGVDDWDLPEDEGPPLNPAEARAAFGLGCLLGATGIVVLLALIALFVYAFLRSPVG